MSQTEDEAPEPVGPIDSAGNFAVSRSDYSDSRPKGDYESRYSGRAWLQIGGEGTYLLLVMVICAIHLLFLLWRPQSVLSELALVFRIQSTGDLPYVTHVVRLWLTVFFSGVLGGATFSLKWLYHSVSWMEWNRDRIVWRISVPIIGGLLAVFTGCMVMSGIIPLLTKELFSRLPSCAGFGFFVGLFADNFLAALQTFAKKLLGTLGKSA